MRKLFSVVAAVLLTIATAAYAATLSVCPADPASPGDERSEMYGADGKPIRLLVTDTAVADQRCDMVTLAVAANQVRWFALTELTRTTAPGMVTLQGFFRDSGITISEVIGDPVNQVEPEALPPAKPAAPAATTTTVHRRSTWLWAPAWWQSRVEQAWQLAASEQLQKFHVSVPVGSDGSVENAAQLAAFIAAARTRQIEVWAVLGDRHDVLAENLPLLLQRVQAYLAYNATQPPEARLAGVQLDIEPYLLPGYALAPGHWRERYLATITAVHTALAQRMPLDLVMPVWWGTHPDWGSHLLDALALPQLSLTIMNYRTNGDALREGAVPFLAWGQRSGNRVTIALESGVLGINAGSTPGKVSSEARRRYVSDGTVGELWLFDIGGTGMLVLLDGSHGGLPGRPYRFANESVFDIGNVTFAGKRETLRELAPPLEAEWSVWKSFNGLAVHGLDQIQQQSE